MMHRKLYIWVAALLGLAGIVLVLQVLRVNDSVPAIVNLPGRYWPTHLVSRAFFIRAILVDAFLLPVTCWVFAAVAHAGQIEIDIFSWLFVAAFYGAFLWLGFEVDHVYLYQTPEGANLPTSAISNPLWLLAVAVATGLSFWKWKQQGKL